MRPSIIIADRAELARTIDREIQDNGPLCDLNHLDVSNVVQMHYLFSGSPFNGDISRWDVSNVEDMRCMFENSKFRGDISEWNVERVQMFQKMFAETNYHGDLSLWHCDSAVDMREMNSKMALYMMEQPCVGHWLAMLEKTIPVQSMLKNHFDDQRDLLLGLGLTNTQAAVQMHRSWLVPKVEPACIALPDLGDEL